MVERKIIFIEIDDEITTIVSKVEKSKAEAVAIVFPERALIFESIINMKLLFEELKTLKKDVQVATRDKVGLNLLTRAGFLLYESKLKGTSKQDTKFEKNPIVRVQKLKPEGLIYKPQRVPAKKLSLTELIAQEEKKRKTVETKREANVSKELELKSSEFRMWSERLLNITIKRRNFILFLIGAIGLFLSISYVALPSATIKIRPASNVIEKTTNLVLASQEQKKAMATIEKAHAITTFPVETIIERTEEFPASGEIFTGTNARGKILIKNHRLKAWTLIKDTRFQTEDGLIFRIQEKIDVPGAQYSMVRTDDGKLTREKVPGTLIMEVVADGVDAAGKAIGERGNIQKGVRLNVPALDPTSQTILYAEADENFTGGVTESYRVLTEEDIETATEKIKEHIEESVKGDFRTYVAQQNAEKGLHLVLLEDDSFIKYRFLELDLPKEEIGKPKASFEAKAKVEVRGVAYDEEEFYRVLENELKSKVHPQKKLVAIERNSMTYRIVTSDSVQGDLNRIKLAVTIKGIEEFDINLDSETGYSLMKRIKEGVLGKDAYTAKYFVQNLEEIDNVEIRVWPFWSSRVPALDSNVKFKIL